MKNIAFAALAAVPCIVAVAPAATIEEYTAVMDEQLSAIKEMVTILTTVKDKASADAAAEKLVALIEKAEAVEAKADALGEPSPEIVAQLREIFVSREEEIKEVFSGLLPVAFQLGMEDFYGSTQLKEVMEALASDGEEEEDVEEDAE